MNGIYVVRMDDVPLNELCWHQSKSVLHLQLVFKVKLTN